jgi:hypothetical protein
MKHPFFTLYYTGLGILVSIILMVGLFAANFSNLASIFTKDRPEPAPYNKQTNTKIFKDFSVDEVKPDRLPVKPKVQSGTKEVSTPTQQPPPLVPEVSDSPLVPDVTPPLVPEIPDSPGTFTISPNIK